MATRPDLAHALSVLSKYTSAPREQHWQAVKRVMRYLQATCNYGLLYQPVKEPRVICYTDADYGGDHQNRKSTSGVVTMINTAPITYKSKQQDIVTLSTTEAEYVACTFGVKDLIWIERFIRELQAPLSRKAILFCDNQSAIRLIKNPEFHERTKHIDIRYHFIRDTYASGLFDLEYIQSDIQKADVFTKALTSEKHNMFRSSIGCVQNDESRRVLE